MWRKNEGKVYLVNLNKITSESTNKEIKTFMEDLYDSLSEQERKKYFFYLENCQITLLLIFLLYIKKKNENII